MQTFGAIEAGGTKVVCAVGSGPDDLRDVEAFPTTTPAETLARAVDYFAERPVAALGVGSFGPVDLDPQSPTWGHVTSTPKPGWRNADVAGPLGDALGVPVAFETDVNTAALAEHRWGAACDIDSFIYLTVGTGIGGGAFVDGRPIHGRTHPEMGHLLIPREPGDDFPGVCPYHGDCWEGLASGPAIEARWGRPAQDLPPDHEAWPLQARTLARGLVNLILTLSPQRIVMGGGVMKQTQLFPLIRAETEGLLAGYVPLPADLATFIVPTSLDGNAGVLGAIALARDQLAGDSAGVPVPASPVTSGGG
ncbi:MAG: ROK family protein [Bacteroidota bacterium]